MAHLDVHPMPGTSVGYVVDVQANLFSELATRVVVPLIHEQTAPTPIRDLNPIFEIDGERHVMITQAIASIPRQELKRPIKSLADQRDSITRALDILFVGV